MRRNSSICQAGCHHHRQSQHNPFRRTHRQCSKSRAIAREQTSMFSEESQVLPIMNAISFQSGQAGINLLSSRIATTANLFLCARRHQDRSGGGQSTISLPFQAAQNSVSTRSNQRQDDRPSSSVKPFMPNFFILNIFRNLPVFLLCNGFRRTNRIQANEQGFAGLMPDERSDVCGTDHGLLQLLFLSLLVSIEHV